MDLAGFFFSPQHRFRYAVVAFPQASTGVDWNSVDQVLTNTQVDMKWRCSPVPHQLAMTSRFAGVPGSPPPSHLTVDPIQTAKCLLMGEDKTKRLLGGVQE